MQPTTTQEPVRIAMWSGPRNISTALLRSWGNRADTHVCDEPLYAHYLLHTGIDHPGADEVMRHHETDWRRVVETLLGPVPGGKPVFYQKQMAHHLLPHIDRSWLRQVVNCFLIRDPGEMLTSLVRHLPGPTLADTGLPQQVEIFDEVLRRTGRTPPVIDARDVLTNPQGVLEALCRAIGIDFATDMLSWPPGQRETDGVWAEHWYDTVVRSTGFKPYRPKDETVPPELQQLHTRCGESYRYLHRHRIVAM